MINLALSSLVLILALPQTILWSLPVFTLLSTDRSDKNTRLVCEDVVNLILGFTVWGDPCPASVRSLLEQCVDYLQTVVLCKLDQHVASLVPFSQAILSSALFHALSQSDFGIDISHDYVVVSSAVGENVVNVFIYLWFLLIRWLLVGM